MKQTRTQNDVMMLNEPDTDFVLVPRGSFETIQEFFNYQVRLFEEKECGVAISENYAQSAHSFACDGFLRGLYDFDKIRAACHLLTQYGFEVTLKYK